MTMVSPSEDFPDRNFKHKTLHPNGKDWKFHDLLEGLLLAFPPPVN